MPGTMITNGMNIFGNAAMIGERRAEEIEFDAMVSTTLSFSPFQPPTRIRPKMVSGTNAARMTKNCSTSLWIAAESPPSVM